MKKRKRDEGGSLDSLLDTMTTVVGILIILLIVVQLGADSAVKRIVEEQKQEDAQLLEDMAMRQFDQQRSALLAEKQRLQQQAAANNQTAQKLLNEIVALEKRLSTLRSQAPDLPKLNKDLQTLAQQLLAAQKEEDKKAAQLKRLRALIAKAPKPTPASLSKDVNLPDPKPAPPGAKPFRFLCREGKIYPLDDLKLRKLAENAVNASGLKKNEHGEYDGKKLAAHLAQKKAGDPHFTLKAQPGADKLIRFTMQRRPNAGEDPEALAKPNSAYQKTLASLKPTERYLQFEVFPDSFQTYLAARALAARKNFPAGWKPAHRQNDWWSYYWGHKDLGRSQIPPPPKPKPPKPGAPKPKPKPPENVID